MASAKNLYNAQLKEWFISTLEEESTRHAYRYALAQCYETESQYDRDVITFNKEELEELFMSFRCPTKRAIQSQVSKIRSYIYWCANNGHLDLAMSYIDSFTTSKLDQYIDYFAFINQYIANRDELYELASRLQNKQDAVLLILPYEGIDGKLHSEIRGLKTSDCDFKNNTIVIERNGKRETFDIPKRSMDIIESAALETEYAVSNGNASPNAKYPFRDLVQTEYVLKISRANANIQYDSDESMVKPITVNSRVAAIAKWCKKPGLNPTNILVSGLINYLRNIEEYKGKELETKDYEYAMLRYGMTTEKDIENPKKLIGSFGIKDIYTMFTEQDRNR